LQDTVTKQPDLAKRLEGLAKPVADLEEGLLVSATYDGEKKVAVLKFYDAKQERVWLWEDNTGHEPYCYSKLPLEKVKQVVAGRKDIVEIREEVKLDLLSDSKISLRKIIATDPLAIGGNPGKSLRDFLECWEADIKYFENYVYDKGLKVGTYYKITNGSLAPIDKEVVGEVKRSLDSILAKASGDAASYIKAWAELLGQPLSDFKRIACDIEVANEENRIPDPETADREVIAVSFCNDKESVVYVMDRGGQDKSLDGALTAYTHEVFPDEASLLRATFAKMMDYPFLVTFNGDDFDLRYLKHRALRKEIGIKEEEIPIALQRQEASLKHGVHIDLYRFFNNRSIQVYVYGNRYTEHTLNGISEALLNKSKIEFEGNIGELPLVKLADYCLNDSQITYELTSANDSLLMKILLVISRIAKMPMNDVARLGVSNWIRSMLYYEHRRIGALIPRTDELAKKGGASSEAIIKGKKYKGGLVIEPKPGTYFGVSVLDFASLYPSIIKVHNLSYETVNCGHEECRSNRVPDTDHWVCKKRSGIESLVIGSLRDLRVGHYKVLAKDKTIPKESKDLYGTVTQGLKVILNACFTGDTLVVTPNGVRNIKDLSVGDQVINVNPEKLVVEVDKVVEVQAFPYRGDMYHFKDDRFVDLIVTPNHRLLTVDRRKSSRSGAIFRTAEEVRKLANIAIPKLKSGVQPDHPPGRISLLETAKEMNAYASFYPPEGTRLINWFRTLPPELRQKIRLHGRVRKLGTQHSWATAKKKRQSHYLLPASKVNEDDLGAAEKSQGQVLLGEARSRQIPAHYDAQDFASLCGWFVSEGNLHAAGKKAYANGNVRGRTASIVISQGFGKGNVMGVSYRNEIEDLLGKLGLRNIQDSLSNKYYKVTSSILNQWMLSQCYTDGTARHDAHSKRIPAFVFRSPVTMKAFLAAVYEGDGNRRGIRYSTVSLKLAQDLVVLLSFLGFKAKLTYDSDSRIYRIVFKNVSSKLTYAGAEKEKHLKILPFDGIVHCVTTERNHTVIAGRNGNFVPVGQSYGVMGFETFALYCLPVAEATAALGRDAITRTIEKCKQGGVSVIYSDSVTRERNVTVSDPSGQVRVLPIERLFDLFADVRTRPDGKDEVRPKGWKTLSMDPKSGETGWKDIAAIIRHRNGKTIYRVWDKLGSTRVTEDHSLLVSDGRGRVLSRPQDLAGKHLLRIPALPPSGQIREIDLFELLRPVKYETRYKGRLKTLEAHCDDEWVWYSWTNRKNPIKLRRHIPVGSPEFNALVELLGAYIPEGSSSTPETTNSRMGASIACSDVEWLRRLQQDYNLLFSNARASVIPSMKAPRDLRYQSTGGEIVQVTYQDDTHKLQMMNKLSAVFFKALCGQKSDGKHLPDFIFNVPSEFKRLLLENMVKGDGSRVFGKAYSQDYRAKNFRYESKSLGLISGLSTLLLQLGVNHTIGYRPSKETHWIATSAAFNRTRRAPRVAQEDYEGYVYDLSVEEFHTFVDSCGSIVLKNTDSLFIENPDKDKVTEVLRWADKELGVELEVDKTYRYVAFSERKKNYFGVLQDGTADIKGLTGKKSVSGDTPILARIDGRATYTTVQGVYKRFVERHSVELPTIDDDLHTKWAVVSDAFEHSVDDIYVLRTSKGRTLKLSGDHSVFFIDRFGRLYCKETRSVRVGEILVGARHIPATGTSATLDLREYLKETRENDGLLYSSQPHSTTGTPIRQMLAVTKDVGLIFGIFTAEGSTASRKGSRSNDISQSESLNPEVCRALRAAWSSTFGWELNEFRAPNRRTFYLPILYARLFREMCGKASREKHVPDFIFCAPIDVVSSYLRGLFSGDGWSNGRKISIASESRTLIEQVCYLLAYFDIDCRIRTCYNSRFKIYYYQLSVIGTSSRRRFQEQIGFLQPRFQEVPAGNPRNKELLPISTSGLIQVKASMLRRLGLAKFRHISMHDERFFNVSLLKRYNDVIDALTAYADDFERGALAGIRKMLNNQDVTYDEVVELERMPGTCLMYDFSVPKFERFVAGNLPSLLHNSQTPEFLKKEFYEMLDILGNVHSQGDFVQAKSRIKDLLTDMVASLRDRRIPIADLSFNVMMGKSIDGYRSAGGPEPSKKKEGQKQESLLRDGHEVERAREFENNSMSGLPQHVKAAILLRNSGREVKAGELISFVKTKGGHGVKPTEQAKPEDIDVEKYIEYASSMFDQVLSALDLSFESVVPKTSLDAFWS